MKKIREKYIENKIKKHLEQNGHYYIKIHGSLFQKSGTPDILACINGYFVGIEVKREKGIASKLQEEVIKEINTNKGKAKIVYSFEEYLDFYKEVIESAL